MKTIPTVVFQPQNGRACVLFPGALGDFVCFLPALNALAARSELDLFAQSRFADIVPAGVAVCSMERPEITKLFTCDSAGDPSLKKFFGAYARVYSWMGGANQGFADRLQALAGASARLFPFRPQKPDCNQTDYYLRCLDRDEVLPRQPRLSLRRDAISWCDNLWATHALHRRPVLAISPGSGAREKNWPEDFFVKVAQWWLRVTAGAVILLAGPVELERGGIEKLRRSCLPVEEPTLSQAAALLSRCAIYLGNDSGMSHLAAALGIRTIAIFGPSDARQWAPPGAHVTVVRRNLACSPCPETIMKSCPHRACLSELQPKEVIGILAALSEVVTLTR